MSTKQTQNLYTKQTRNHPFGMAGVLFSVGLVFLFSVSFVQPVRAADASLYLLPEKGSFGMGEIFSVDLKVNTDEAPINAIEATLYFPEDKLKALEVLKENSIFSFWPEEPSFSNLSGKITFSGGTPHPGFNGKEGHIITIKFEAQKEGRAKLRFGESKILADDGQGTNIFSYAVQANYIIKPAAPLILSSSHPNQDQWYSNNSPEIRWDIAPEITEVSFVLDKSQKTLPDEISEGRLTSKTFKEIEDGIWYFHLKVKSEQGWSSVNHFLILIDTQPPESFEIAIDNGGDSTNPSPILYFDAEDSVSGISHYQVKVEEEEEFFITTLESNPFQIPPQLPGIHKVFVEAVDLAGNSRESATQVEIEPIKTPFLTVWPEKYIAGEETFYLEGVALPEVEITIFIKKNGKKIKEWQVLSGSEGEWSFSTKELFKSGIYQLMLKAKDKRGAVSLETQPKTIEIRFSGLALGPVMITFRMIVLVLSLISILGILMFLFLIFQTRQNKKILKKETKEAKESVETGFLVLKAEIAKRIEMLDSRPGFTEEERKIYEDLREILKNSEEFISKEIEDVERELK